MLSDETLEEIAAWVASDIERDTIHSVIVSQHLAALVAEVQEGRREKAEARTSHLAMLACVKALFPELNAQRAARATAEAYLRENAKEAEKAWTRAHELEQALATAEKFKSKLIDAAVVSWVYRKEHETDWMLCVNELITNAVQQALDPAISKDAAELRATAYAEGQRDAVNRVITKLAAEGDICLEADCDCWRWLRDLRDTPAPPREEP